jgi:D-alanyl-D-alanine carboxypeptidase
VLNIKFRCLRTCRNAAISLSTVLFVVASLIGISAFPTPGFAQAKYAAFVMDAKTGRVLFSRNANALRYPASLTKMMTLYLTFQELQAGRIRKSTRFRVSRLAAGQAPSKLGLRAGQRISVQKLILALVTKSANDAAVVLAEGISGTHSRFARRMTTTARGLGMKRTTFKNANGLPNRRQRTTARDMSTLALRLMTDFPRYYPYFRVRSFTYNGRTYYSYNRLLRNYAGTDGVKTGYTRASGFNLTTSVRRKGKHLIGVVLGGKTGKWRDQRMRTILTRAFPKAISSSIQVADRKFRIKPTKHKKVARRISKRQKQRLTRLIAQYPKQAKKRKSAPATRQKVDLASLWKIQVGAFALRRMAQDRLEFILDKKFKPLKYAKSKIVRAKKNGRDLYRVRFAGLDEDAAEAVCMSLQDDKVGCYALAPPQPRVQALLSQ